MKKISKIIVLTSLIFVLTGCTKYLYNEDNKIIKNEKTGQNITQNILCRPNEKENLKYYDENNNKIEQQIKINDKRIKELEKSLKEETTTLEEKSLKKELESLNKSNDKLEDQIVDLNKLPECSELKINDKNYSGIWNTLFVQPLAWLIVKIGLFVNNYGVAVILTTLIIRLIVYPVTKGMAEQSENMKAAKPELEKLENKYKNQDQKEVTMQKTQEMMLIYKKYNIKPMSSCLFSVIQIPLFFAFYEAMNRLPALFEEKFLIYDLGKNPLAAFKQGNYLYLIIVVIIVAVTYLSFKMNSKDTVSINKDQEKQMKLMSNIMTIFISVASLTLPVGLGLYWIANSGFTILQNIIVKRRKINGVVK